ncbi:MAG: hypothetical protein IT365_02125 [Candidatus Hydrogenedentes bacterium]|nr:hypothetical protein [Candidatus Hydrogenedentota bacterium]
MDRATFKEICRNRRTSWGTIMIEYMTPSAVRTFARAGLDWLWIDNEHGCHSYETICQAAHTAEDVGIMSILRVTQGNYDRIAQALDMAVSGIIVPRVETPEQVRQIVDCAKYPPVGKRGFGMRASLFGQRRISMRERVADQNETRFLFIQLESPQAVEQIEPMIEAAQGQLDGIFYGPADFQIAIGRLDSPHDPEVVGAARHITSISQKHHLSNGVPATSLDAARHYRELGFNLITFKSDGQFMIDGAYDGVVALRDLG